MALNLRLTGVAARELGVETHVCEVQLLLRPFAELKVRRRWLRSVGWLRRVGSLQRSADVTLGQELPGLAPS